MQGLDDELSDDDEKQQSIMNKNKKNISKVHVINIEEKYQDLQEQHEEENPVSNEENELMTMTDLDKVRETNPHSLIAIIRKEVQQLEQEEK